LFLIVFVFVFAFAFLISIAVSVGSARFFLRGLKGESKISNVLYAFKSRNYWNVILVEVVHYGILTVFTIPALALNIFTESLVGELLMEEGM